MACNITLGGIPVDCEASLGGIKKVYITDYDNVTGYTLKETTEDKISAITMKSEAKFKAYNFRKNTSSLTSTLTVDEAAGTNFVSNVLSMIFTKMETRKRIEIAALAVGHMAVIVLDSNGVYWYITPDDYASATNGSGNTGTAKSDSNNYTIEITADSKTFPLEVEATAIADIVEETAE